MIVPTKYEHRRIKNIDVSDNNVLVEFVLDYFYRLLIYSDKIEGLNSIDACSIDGTISKQIEEHWYICHQDSN